MGRWIAGRDRLGSEPLGAFLVPREYCARDGRSLWRTVDENFTESNESGESQNADKSDLQRALTSCIHCLGSDTTSFRNHVKPQSPRATLVRFTADTEKMKTGCVGVVPTVLVWWPGPLAWDGSPARGPGHEQKLVCKSFLPGERCARSTPVKLVRFVGFGPRFHFRAKTQDASFRCPRGIRFVLGSVGTVRTAGRRPPTTPRRSPT